MANVELIEDLMSNGAFEYSDDDLEILNRHARVFYALFGYQVKEGFDFTTSHHKTEIMCFLMACYAKNAADEGCFE